MNQFYFIFRKYIFLFNVSSEKKEILVQIFDYIVGKVVFQLFIKKYYNKITNIIGVFVKYSEDTDIWVLIFTENSVKISTVL